MPRQSELDGHQDIYDDGYAQGYLDCLKDLKQRVILNKCIAELKAELKTKTRRNQNGLRPKPNTRKTTSKKARL